MRAAIDGVDAGRLVQHSLDDADVVAPIQNAVTIDVVAAGKAAGVMLSAFVSSTAEPIRRMLGI